MTPQPAPAPRYDIVTPTPPEWARKVYIALDRYERELPPAWLCDAVKK